MIRLIPAEQAHVLPIAEKMREADVMEVTALGSNPYRALGLGLTASACVMTALLDGVPEAMMGVTPVNILERTGAPWMLGSEEIYRHPRAMLALGPKVIERWRDSTGLRSLSNMVGKSNLRAIRLLRRWQFSIGNEVTVVRGVEFVTFSMEA